MKNYLTAESSHGIMDIFVAAPETKEKLPVVIVLQEAFGVNQHIRSICERLAMEGFMAVAPELYHRFGKNVVVDYADRKKVMQVLGKLTNSEIIQDIRETINFLENIPHADTQNVSTLGFCVGGFASTLAATKLNIKKMVSFYGAGLVYPREGLNLVPVQNGLSDIKAQCLFFFGGEDASISKDERQLIQEKLKKTKVKNEMVIYEGRDHGFFCEERKTYDEKAAIDAWEKTLTFLRK